MKKYLLLLTILVLCGQFLHAQSPLKVGYVDSQIILTQFPEAIKAQGDLDALISKWNNQVDSMTSSYQQALGDYQKQANTMPEEKKLQTQQSLIKQEQDILEFRRQKFAQNTGEIYRKQEQIFNPVKEKIYATIEKVAKEEDVQFVFDKSGDIILLYADPAFDLTYKVLDRLKRGK